MRRTSPALLSVLSVSTLVAVLVVLVVAVSPTAAQGKKPEAGKMVKKQFHESLYLEYVADKSKWRDLGRTGLGIRYADLGPVVIMYGQYFQTAGRSGNVEIEGRKVNPGAHTALIKAFQKGTAEGFKKVFKEGKTKKFKCKAGKGAYIDLIAAQPESKRARAIVQQFTSIASGVDVSRPYDPKSIKVHVRWIAIKQKEGVHWMMMMATEGVLKKQKKDIGKILKGFTAE